MDWLRSLLQLVLLASLSTTASIAEPASTPSDQSPTSGLIIAQLNPEAAVSGISAISPLLQQNGLRVNRVIAFARADLGIVGRALRQERTRVRALSRAPVFLILETTGAEAAGADTLATLLESGRFRSVERDSTRHFSTTTNEMVSGQIWHLFNYQQQDSLQYLLGADINAPIAWDVSQGTRQTITAIIDDGVFFGHPDLHANMWRNPSEIDANHIDDDGDGLVDNIYGADFGPGIPDGSPIPINPSSHGTRVAGVIGAVGNNGDVTSGVTTLMAVGAIPNTQMMAIKIADPTSTGFPLSAALDAYAFVAQKRAAGINVRVINASYGGPTFSQAELDAIAYLGSLDILFVAAAGNDATSEFSYPASYALDSIISVAASDGRDEIAPFSNYGDVAVDLAAPGTQIFTTAGGNSYARVDGTSFSAPMVAATAALIWDTDQSLTSTQVRQRILSSVDVMPSLQAYVATHGRLNMGRALGIDMPSRPPDGRRCFPSANMPPVPSLQLGSTTHGLVDRPTAGSIQRLVFTLGSTHGCQFPLEYVLVLANGQERPITHLRPLIAGFTRLPVAGLVDLRGVPAGVLSASVRVQPAYRYQKGFGYQQPVGASVGAPIVISPGPGELTSAVTAASTPDVSYFDPASDLGSIRRLQPGWTSIGDHSQAFDPRVNAEIGISGSQSLAQPLSLMGATIPAIAIRDGGALDQLRIMFCTNGCQVLPMDTGAWLSPPTVSPPPRLYNDSRWLTLRIDGAFFATNRAGVNAGELWKSRKQILTRTVPVLNASGVVVDQRQYILVGMSGGPGTGQNFGPTGYIARDDWGVRISYLESRPNEFDIAITRRTRDLPGANTTRLPRMEAYYRGRNYQLPVASLVGAYTRTPHANGAFYTYQQAVRITTTPTLNASFTDVPSSSPSFMSIEAAARTGIVTGCTASAFCPTSTVTRGEAAAAITRGFLGRDAIRDYSTAPASGFSDLPPSNPYARYVGALADRNIFTGCGGANFCPSAPLTRQELALWLRGAYVALHGEPTNSLAIIGVPLNIGRFRDLPAGSPETVAAETVAGWGVMPGCNRFEFCPGQVVQRDEFATIMERVLTPYSASRY